MLIKPLITEKTMARAAQHDYTFVVSLNDTKTQIKEQIEKTFAVKVLRVRTAVFVGKSYRSGRRGTKAMTGSWKKALVTLGPDQKIDLFEVPASS